MRFVLVLVLGLGLVLFLLLLLGFLGIVREREKETEQTKSKCIGNCEKWESSQKQWRMEENCSGCGLCCAGGRGGNNPL